MRLFIALPLPKEVKEKIGVEVISRFPSKFFKVVKSDNLHFTICFIGEKSDSEVSSIVSVLYKLSFSSFSVSVSKLGNFKKRVFWLGVSNGSFELEALSKLVCSKLGVSFSGSPHLTIARAKPGFESEAFSFFSKFNTNFSCDFVVDRVSLFSSVLSSSGPIYSELGFKILSKMDSGS
ncbi:MAG: RNA 2',3'-cyclic phosphodiesterase [Candidatus Diapherotrites archaeon]